MAKITYVFDTENEEDKRSLAKIRDIDRLVTCLWEMRRAVYNGVSDEDRCDRIKSLLEDTGLNEYI